MLRERGVMTLVRAGHVPSIVQEVCGGPVRGSWWGHPRGRIIYAIASALEEPEVLALKLIDGKVTFVHRSLWPALFRFATDRKRRSALLPSLRPPERRLLAEVERRGEIHFGGSTPPPASTRAALERRWLCISTSEHTASGRHAPVLRSWRHRADPEVLRAARALTFESARQRLVETCGGLGDADPAGERAGGVRSKARSARRGTSPSDPSPRVSRRRARSARDARAPFRPRSRGPRRPAGGGRQREPR